MIKKISFYLLAFVILFTVAFGLHQYILKVSNIDLQFSLLQVYIFHLIFSFAISTLVFVLSNSQKWLSQLGFIYIFTLITKVLFFATTFKDPIFTNQNLSKLDSINLLIPLFLYLFLEVYFIVKILNKK